VPFSNGIFRGGNHRSHWAESPASQDSRSAGSTGLCSGRNRATFSRNHDSDPCQPTRSASTLAGRSGFSFNSVRTLGSNTANDDSAGARSYLGGAWEVTAFTTVVREIPNRLAIAACGVPSAASLLISAQSSIVITLRSCRVFTFHRRNRPVFNRRRQVPVVCCQEVVVGCGSSRVYPSMISSRVAANSPVVKGPIAWA